MSKSSKYTLEWVSDQINAVGYKKDLIDIFPTNYYKKINLDLTGCLKIKK